MTTHYTDKLLPGPEEFPEFAGWLLAQAEIDLETLCQYYNLWLSEEQDDATGQHKMFRIIMAIGEVAISAMGLRGDGDDYSERLAADNRDALRKRRDAYNIDSSASALARETMGVTPDVWDSLSPEAKVALMEIINRKDKNDE